MYAKRTQSIGWLMVFAAIIAGAGLAYGYWMIRKDTQDTPLPTEGIRPAAALRVSAWGRLAPQSDVIPLSAAANQLVACVEELLVGEGDVIAEGQPIAILDSHERRKATVEEAEARVASARAKLDAVRAGAKPEELAVQQAMIDVNQAEFDEAKQQYDRGSSMIAAVVSNRPTPFLKKTRPNVSCAGRKQRLPLFKRNICSNRSRILALKISPLHAPK
jgi:HlyD family secretion protein